MTFLVITLDGIRLDDLLADERLGHLRSLLAAGLYGPLADRPGSGPALAELTSPTPAGPDTAGDLAAAFGDLRLGRTATAESPIVVRTIALDSTALVDLDDQLGELLAALTEDTGLLLVTRAAGTDGFVIAGPGIPPAGAVAEVTAAQLATTVRELTGLPPLVGDAADSLLARADLAEHALSGYSAEDDLLIQERLSGLGYIA